jgi:S-adenosyl methyltransferase
MRTHEGIVGYFDGLDLVEPGLVSLPYWRPATEPPGLLIAYAGVARKP